MDIISLNELENKYDIDLSEIKNQCLANKIATAKFDIKLGWLVSFEVLENFLNDKSECRLCREINNKNIILNLKLGISNTVLAKNGDWLVLPALGSVVPGYIMIVNVNHSYHSIACCPDAQLQKLEETICLCKKSLKKIYHSNCILFEHGVLTETMIGSNSVDHVHLHILPIELDLYNTFCHEETQQFYGFDELKRIALKNNIAYLFYENQYGKRFYIKDKNGIFPSQFFRRQVAMAVGKSEEWNWRIFPHYEEFLNTYNSLVGKIK